MLYKLSNTPLSRVALYNYALLAIPAGLLALYFLVAIQTELTVLQERPSSYAIESAVIDKPGTLRKIVSALRTASPFYVQSDPFSEYLRDLRLGLIIIWASLSMLGFVLVRTLSKQLEKQLDTINLSIVSMANNRTEPPLQLEGPINVRTLSKNLERLRERLIKNDHHQLQFIRHISHQVKTPLASIKEGVKLINEGLVEDVNEEQKEITGIIHKNTQELQTAIESLLDYNIALTTRRQGGRKTIDLRSVIDQAIDRQGLAIKAKRLKLDLFTEKAIANINFGQMLTVFENLLSNAVKYSPLGGEIEIRLFREQGMIHFLIQDNGPGIPEHNRLAVFNAFFVGDERSPGPLKGTGLGLSIARQYVEMHQGIIEVLEPQQINLASKLTGALFRVCIEDEYIGEI